MKHCSLALVILLLSVAPALAQDGAQATVEPAPVEPAPVEPAPVEPATDQADQAGPLRVSVFVDSYYAFNSQLNSAIAAAPAPHRAYVRQSGFSLSFVGLDTSYHTDTLAATLNLRGGPSTPYYYGAPADPTGALNLANLFEAYGTWKASDQLSVDVGKFTTIYGAEVMDSWKNMNYTRGALCYIQPFWHTGVRASYQVSDALGVKAMVVNGVNNGIDNDDALPSVGAQGSVALGDNANLTVGYLAATDPANEAVDHLIDVIAAVQLGPLALLVNADLALDVPGDPALDTTAYLAVAASAGYTISDRLRVAGRAEYFLDADNAIYAAGLGDSMSLVTGTVTLDVRPLGNEHLFIRWDNRIESGSEDIFTDRDGAPTATFFQSVVGFVVTSGTLSP